ncbi:hypothetical protein ACQP3J_33485, partial [Escherichia coli]
QFFLLHLLYKVSEKNKILQLDQKSCLVILVSLVPIYSKSFEVWVRFAATLLAVALAPLWFASWI